VDYGRTNPGGFEKNTGTDAKAKSKIKRTHRRQPEDGEEENLKKSGRPEKTTKRRRK